MISICMATYNGEKWILEQLNSILTQLTISDEIIIADDNSTDNTVKIIKDLKDDRIKLFEFKDSVGAAKNFERALLKTQGEIIFLADQDDVWLDNKVKKMVEALSDSSLVMHDAKVIDAEKNIIYDSYFKVRDVKHGMINNIIKNSYTGAMMAFKRELLDLALPIPNRAPHDPWIALIAECCSNTKFIKDKLILWRRHKDTVTKFNSFYYSQLFNMAFSRIYMFLFSFSRMIRGRKK